MLEHIRAVWKPALVIFLVPIAASLIYALGLNEGKRREAQGQGASALALAITMAAAIPDWESDPMLFSAQSMAKHAEHAIQRSGGWKTLPNDVKLRTAVQRNLTANIHLQAGDRAAFDELLGRDREGTKP